jgi:hypothetical protein
MSRLPSQNNNLSPEERFALMELKIDKIYQFIERLRLLAMVLFGILFTLVIVAIAL